MSVLSTGTKAVAAFVQEQLRRAACQFSLGRRIELAKVGAQEFGPAGLPTESEAFASSGATLVAYHSFDAA